MHERTRDDARVAARRIAWRFLHTVLLAGVLLSANSLSAVAMTAAAFAPHPNAAAHDCHDASHKPAGPHVPCPCCGHGCACLHAPAVSPGLMFIPASAPGAELVRDGRTVPPSPLVALRLRPPIA